METVNIYETKFAPSNDVVQTHEPPPSYSQINTQMMQNPVQYPSQPYSIEQNGQMIPSVFVNNGMNGHSSQNKSIVNVHDYLAWSIFNILCCGLWCGLVALVLSLKTRSNKRKGDLEGAKKVSSWALTLNTFATIVGIIVVIILIVRNSSR